jgi:3-hydroxyacyl-CoA dehydrogenase
VTWRETPRRHQPAPVRIDLVFVNGYGFPRQMGGPMFAAGQRGLAGVLLDAEEAACAGGAGSEPAPLLVQLAREGSSFAQWKASQSGRQAERAS